MGATEQWEPDEGVSGPNIKPALVGTYRAVHSKHVPRYS
jgi:hypothetical protein